MLHDVPEQSPCYRMLVRERNFPRCLFWTVAASLGEYTPLVCRTGNVHVAHVAGSNPAERDIYSGSATYKTSWHRQEWRLHILYRNSAEFDYASDTPASLSSHLRLRLFPITSELLRSVGHAVWQFGIQQFIPQT